MFPVSEGLRREREGNMRQGPDLNRGAHGGTIEDEALALVAHVIKQGTQVPMRPTSCTSRREDVGM